MLDKSIVWLIPLWPRISSLEAAMPLPKKSWSSVQIGQARRREVATIGQSSASRDEIRRRASLHRDSYRLRSTGSTSLEVPRAPQDRGLDQTFDF
jgi:hypothetical protein